MSASSPQRRMKRNMPCIGFAFLLVVSEPSFAEEPEVNTNFGPIRGVWLRTTKGCEIAGFLGIPYAEPPIGELRFENPRPWTKQWKNGTLDATTDGSMCLQKSTTKEIIGNEDCLFLNIYTPTISKNQLYIQQKKLSVLVFIHGGGFRTGSSNSSLFAPTYLLDYDIILVTMNYRLNVLGFFSTGSKVTPGNYGLKDIVLALAWVRDNIGAFGGDAEAVTLAGHDAGAVAAQIIAARINASEGLFHKLITMSGTATSHWSVQTRKNIRNSSIHVATLVGCKNKIGYFDDLGSGDYGAEIADVDDSSEDIDKKMIDCMKGIEAIKIVDQGDDHAWQRHPMLIFTPTLEAEAEGAILTVHPEWSLSEGLFRDLPWIIGVTDDEGLWKTTDLLLNSEIKDELIQDYEDLLVPYVLEMKNTINNVTAVNEAIREFYFKGDILANFEMNITQLVGDALISWSTYDFMQKQINNMNSNLYFYVFAYEGTFSNTFRWGIPFRFGAAHNDDINYVFPYLNTKFADLELFNTLGDRAIINTMCEMWMNFMKTGVPSAKLTPEWEPYKLNHRFMRFGNGRLTDRETEENFLPERMAFWLELMRNFSVPIEEYRIDNIDDDEVEDSSSAPAPSIQRLLYICVSIFCLCSNFML